jgi:cytochrome c biogenesis protein CcmG/thiol:disulfide interchange protein DsbE
MNRKVLLVGALVVTPLLVFLASGFRFDPGFIESPLIGREAPTFSLVGLDGEVVDLASLRGQPVVINFWATWCQPCIYEHPILIEAARRYEGRASFIGVIYQDNPDMIRRFVRERGAWGPALIDSGSEVAIAYGVYGAPETFVLDADGMIVEKITSAVSWQSLTRLVDSLL